MHSKTKLVATTIVLMLLQQHPLAAQPADDLLKLRKELVPRKAAIRSAILPGRGQVYDKKIWKVPVIYGALGITGSLFAYNLNWYKKFRAGIRVAGYLTSNAGYSKDSTGYFALDRTVRLHLGDGRGLETLRVARNNSRRNVVYSGLYFLAIWSLNVIDAAVDAHLIGFDISDDLSFGIRSSIDITSRTAGLSLILVTKY